MLWKTDVGRFTVYGIEDGWMLRDPLDFMPDSDPAVWSRHPEFLTDGKLRVSFGCFLIVSPDGLAMIDTGAGPAPTSAEFAAGQMPAALQALGVARDDVDVVVHTHLHFDHIGGDVLAGEAFFPSARVMVHQAELDYWFGLDTDAGVRVRDHLGPIGAQIEGFDGDMQVLPGISTTETFGHTPGHVSVGLISEGRRAVVSGDATHHPLQASHPDWNIFADLDKRQATATRRRLFDELTGSGTYLAAGHYPRPGFGTVEVHDSVRMFVPAPVTDL